MSDLIPETPGSLKNNFNATTAPHQEALDRAIKTGSLPYKVNRGLRTRQVGGETVNGYVDTLPSFRHMNIEQWIHTFQDSGITPIKLLDIGYGNGQFMLDVTKEYPTVECTGFGRANFAQLEPPQSGTGRNYELLIENPKIQLVEGDLPLPELISPNLQNIIVVNNVFQYLDLSLQKRTILGIYRTLSLGGIAFINKISLNSSQQVDELFGDLNEGVKHEFISESNAEIGNTLSFKKINS